MSENRDKLPRVVALVPAWNSSTFIEQTLESLAGQTWRNLRVIVSDDASPDNTADLCESFAKCHRGFRVIRQPDNVGWVGNVNALLDMARGDLLFFAFHDDLFEPTYVEELVEALMRNRRAVLAHSDVRLVERDGTTKDLSYFALEGVTKRTERARRMILQSGHWWIPARGLFRARAARRIGGLRRHLAGEFSADWPWLLHMTLLGEFVRVPVPLCTKVYTKQSLSKSWKRGNRAWLAATLSCMREARLAHLPFREEIIVQSMLLNSCSEWITGGIRSRPRLWKWMT